MKRIAYSVLILTVIGCAPLTGIRRQHIYEARRECRNTPDVQTISEWVTEETGIVPDTCVIVQDVVIPVRVGNVAILLVDLDMPMNDWWHLNDVVMAEGFVSWQLSWRDVERLDTPYYSQTLRTLVFPRGLHPISDHPCG